MNADKTTPKRCARCGSECPAETLGGVCVACLLGEAVGGVEVEAGTETLNLEDLPQVGEVVRCIGDFELQELLAHGGMGVVYKAHQISLRRDVALKMLLGGSFASREFKERFRREAQTAAQLQHPNIVPIYEVGEHEGQPYYVMEYVPGRNLGQVLAEGPLPPKRAARYVQILAEAVAFAHARKILHRDLKPSNILIGPGDIPKITDFGLAKQLESSVDLTVAGQALGTPGYLPPEQVSGDKSRVGPTSDVYALGAVLYCSLTGRPPFLAATLAATFQQILEVEPVPLRQLNPEIPRDAETICLKCLAKDPNQRLTSAEALARELSRFVRGEPIASRPVGSLEKTIRWIHRRPMVAGLTGGLALAIVLGVLGIVWQWRRAEAERNLAARSAVAEAGQRAEAETNLWQAVQAVRKYLHNVAADAQLQQADLTELRRRLLEGAVPFYDRFLQQQAIGPGLRAELADTWVQLGEIHRAVGRTEESIDAYLRAAKLLEMMFQDNPESPACATTLCRVRDHLGWLQDQAGRSEEAEAQLHKALDLSQVLVSRFPGSNGYQTAWASYAGHLGQVLRHAGKTTEAEAITRRGLDRLRALAAVDPAVPVSRDKVAALLFELALDLPYTAQPAAREAALRESIQLGEQCESEGSDMDAVRETLGAALHYYGSFLQQEGRREEAMASFRRAIVVRQKLHQDCPNTPRYGLALVETLRASAPLSTLFLTDRYQYWEACSLLENARGVLREVLKRDNQASHRQLLVSVLWEWSGYEARRGDHGLASQLAKEMQAVSLESPSVHRLAGKRLASLVQVARRDERLLQEQRNRTASEYLLMAEECLRWAIQEGDHDLIGDQQDPDLAVVLLQPEMASALRHVTEYYEDVQRDRLILVDEFNGSFHIPWEIRREDQTHYSLSEKSGCLTVHTQPGTFFRGNTNYHNAFLCRLPAEVGDGFELNLKVTGFTFHSVGQYVGPVLFQDERNFMSLGVASPGKLLPGGAVHLVREDDAEDLTVISHSPPAVPSPIWFRLTKWKDQCFFELSEDSRHWRQFRSWTWKAAHPAMLGFIAAVNTSTNEEPFAVEINRFEIWSLKGRAKPH